jgi:2-oxoglutarate dehydrogenase complex dehydrogenase (E1) component-like enzyme
MTPKSLLRHPRATSPVSSLADERFHRVIDDATVQAADVHRVVFCTGKVYYDLLAARGDATDVALVRIELLYPFPAAELSAVFERYDGADVVWVQEEPENMGAWSFVRPQLAALAGRDPVYIGRPMRASPAEGFADAHETEQKRIVSEALRVEAAARPRRGRRQQQS